jgi:hypothetical protein
MKRFLLMLGALAIMATSALADDCNCPKCRAARHNACRPGLFGAHGTGLFGTGLFGSNGGAMGPYAANRAFVSSEYMGPPLQQMPAVAYPYYTTRGPRDFLDRQPWGIGP